MSSLGGSKGPRFRAGSRTSGDFGRTAHRQDVCGAPAPPKTRSIVGLSDLVGGAAREAGPSAAAKRTRAGTRRVWSHSDQVPENSSRMTELVLPRRLHQKSARQSNYKAISWHQFRPESFQVPRKGYVGFGAGVRPKLALRPLQRSQLEKCWVDHRLVARETDSKAVLWQIMCSSVSGPLQYPGYLKAVWPGFFGATTNPWHWSAGLIFGATGTTG